MKSFLLLTLFSSFASAAISITGISGVSRSELDTTDTTAKTYLIYGGIQTGAVVTDFPDCSNAGPCDTCNGRQDGGTANKDLACNLSGVFTTTVISISANGAPSGATKWLLCNTNNGEIDNSGNLSTAIQLTWSELCNGITTGNSTCATDLNNQNVYFGAGTDCSTMTAENRVTLKFSTRDININTWSNTNPTINTYDAACTITSSGACNFQVFPGDEKVYLLKEGTRILSTATDAGSAVTYRNVVVFSEAKQGAETDQATFDRITTASALDRIPIVDGGTIDESTFIDGLTNEVTHCFKIGSEDIAGNIDHISSVDPVANACTMPSEVIGLLTDQKCFIATAAFGSPLDEHVNKLREFRNEFMVSNWLGRKLVKAYYKVSPPLAAWIAEHEWARTTVRGILWPILGWATLSLKFGWIGLLIPFVILAAFVAIYRKRRWA